MPAFQKSARSNAQRAVVSSRNVPPTTRAAMQVAKLKVLMPAFSSQRSCSADGPRQAMKPRRAGLSVKRTKSTEGADQAAPKSRNASIHGSVSLTDSFLRGAQNSIQKINRLRLVCAPRGALTSQQAIVQDRSSEQSALVVAKRIRRAAIRANSYGQCVPECDAYPPIEEALKAVKNPRAQLACRGIRDRGVVVRPRPCLPSASTWARPPSRRSS